MDLLILDSDFNSVFLIDTFKSLLWVERYNKYGDFELYTPFEPDLLTYAKGDWYFWSKESDKMMIIEEFQMQTDADSGQNVIITGRSLESILERRVLLTDVTFTGNLQNGIQSMLNTNIINSTDVNRKIPNFRFEASNDPKVTSVTLEGVGEAGTDLGTIINEFCFRTGLGYKISLSDDNYFVFKLYAGRDFSYEQIANPYIIFSPKFNNLNDSSYQESSKNYKTVAMVYNGTTIKNVVNGPVSGLLRRESLVEVSPETTDAEMEQKGWDVLLEHLMVKTFDGGIETTSSFKLGDSLYLGDIVQIEDSYGLTSRTRITEIIRSIDTSTNIIYPTFEKID